MMEVEVYENNKEMRGVNDGGRSIRSTTEKRWKLMMEVEV